MVYLSMCLCHLLFLSWVLLSSSVQSFQSLSRVRLFVTPWLTAHQASLSITNSWSSPRLMSIESVMPSSHLILCHPLLLLPPIPPSIRFFSNESTFPSYKGTNSIMNTPSSCFINLNIYQSYYFQILLCWWSERQHMYYGWYKHSSCNRLNSFPQITPVVFRQVKAED